MNSKRLGLLATAVALLAAGAYAWIGRQTPESAAIQPSVASGEMVAVTLPELSPEASLGQKVFAARCSACHGPNAGGVDGSGPPLVHVIYEPSHHADAAIYLAALNGVRSHHWRFGDMPPVEGVTKAEMETVVAFIREVQRANGIE